MNLNVTIVIHGGGPGSGPRPGQGKGHVRDFGRRAEDAVRFYQKVPGHEEAMRHALHQYRERNKGHSGPDLRRGDRRVQWEARAAMAAATVQRMNNLGPTEGPHQYAVHNHKGEEISRSRDQRGAEIVKESLDRKKFGLGKLPPQLRKAMMLKDGEILRIGENLRQTTGGSSRNG